MNADNVFVCCHQDGRLCCSFVIRCDDTGRTIGYDGMVAGTSGVPELPSPESVLQPASTAVAVTSTSSTARAERRPRLYRAGASGSTQQPILRPSTASIVGPIQVSATRSTRKYNKAPGVDNTSEVSAEKVVFVSDSEDHDVDNKTEAAETVKEGVADGGDATKGESRGAG